MSTTRITEPTREPDREEAKVSERDPRRTETAPPQRTGESGAPVAREAPSKSRRPRGGGRIFQRGTVFWISFYDHGREHRESAGLQAARGDAEDLLRARLAECHLGQFTAAGRHTTVAEVLDAYERHLQLAGRKIRAMAPQLRRLRARFGALRAREITLPLLERYALDQRQRGLAPGTIKVRLAYLRAAFNVARRGGLIACRPDWPQIRVDNAREGCFTPAELARLIEALPKPLDDVALFASLTGWRREEILGLTWPEVDRATGEIRLAAERSKNRRARPLLLEGLLADLIERRWTRRAPSPWVFHRDGRRIRDFRHVWINALAMAGITAPRIFHDLRRTLVTDLDRAGIAPAVARTFTGHRSEAMRQRYRIVAPREQRGVVAALVAYRAAAVADIRGHEAEASPA